MTPDAISRIKEVFSEASELHGVERSGYLERTCAGDNELRGEVEKLLAALDSEDGVLGSSSIGEFLLSDIAEAQALAVDDRIGAQFRIKRLIGAGGMGEVYEAEDLQLGIDVALKTLRPKFLADRQFLARFRREIRLARRVTHPNVCRIYEYGTEKVAGADVLYLTMELLDGETLAARLKRGPFTEREALPILRQIASALRALHEAQVIHRDLKPANVLLTGTAETPRAVLTDFGLAHAILPGSDETVTIAGLVLGTPAYAAPEQLGGKKVGTEADIYSFGIVMYEVLCGRRPFEAGTAFDSAARNPAAPSRAAAIDPAWDALVLGCLERAPENRIRDAAQLVAQLDGVEQLIASGGTPATKKGAPAARAGRLKWLLAAAATVVVSALLMVGFVASVRRTLCSRWPGSGLVCDLPDDEDIAVFPFRIEGATDGDKALAAGMARHIRETFYRLAPEPDNMCVHLRTDRTSEGVRLVLEGDVEAAAGAVTVRLRVRENPMWQERREALVLRSVEHRWVRPPAAGGSAPELYAGPLEALADALDIRYPPREWQAWLQQGPEHVESVVSYLEGLGRLEAGEHEEAAKAFAEVIDPARSFEFAPAHVGLGDSYRLRFNQTRDPGLAMRARSAYRRALPLDRDFGFAAAEHRLGELELVTGNAAAAAERFAAAVKAWPYDHPVQKRLAVAYETAGKLDDAIAVLREGTRRMPRCWLTHNALASLYSRNGRIRDAENSLLETIRLAPGNGSVYRNLAFDYVKMGRFDDAIEMASKSLQVSPSPLGFSTLGRAFLRRGCTSDGLVNLKKSIELDPQSWVLHANLADALHAASPDSAEAKAAAERTLERCRKHVDRTPSEDLAWAHYAISLQRLGRPAEALQQARQVLSRGSVNSAALVTVAEVMDRGGRRGDALQAIERGLRNGLSLAEIAARRGLAGLQRDARYAAILAELKLNPNADPGGLTPVQATGCPEWGVAGKGLKVQ